MEHRAKEDCDTKRQAVCFNSKLELQSGGQATSTAALRGLSSQQQYSEPPAALHSGGNMKPCPYGRRYAIHMFI